MHDWGSRHRNFTLRWIIYSNCGFWSDQYNYIHVYTDGACRNNGRQNAAAGLGVWWANNHLL